MARRGKGYFNEATSLCSGWDSMWQRFMDRVLAETKVQERFTEHDLRAKVGSDAASLERARAATARGCPYDGADLPAEAGASLERAANYSRLFIIQTPIYPQRNPLNSGPGRI